MWLKLTLKGLDKDGKHSHTIVNMGNVTEIRKMSGSGNVEGSVLFFNTMEGDEQAHVIVLESQDEIMVMINKPLAWVV